MGMSIFAVLMISVVAFANLAFASPNLVKYPGAAANYEDPCNYDKDPIHIKGNGDGTYNVKIHNEAGRSVFKKKSELRPKSETVGNSVWGLGMNILGEPNRVLDKDQSFANMPIAVAVDGQNAVEFKNVRFPDNVQFRMYCPGQFADVYNAASGSKKKHIWDNGAAPLYIWMGGWQAQKGELGFIYTEDPDGKNNGYALVKQGDAFLPCGTGRIYNNIDDYGSQ
jgi:hypothetical protein